MCNATQSVGCVSKIFANSIPNIVDAPCQVEKIKLVDKAICWFVMLRGLKTYGMMRVGSIKMVGSQCQVKSC